MKSKHEQPLQSRDREVGGWECINNHIKNICYISKTSHRFHRIHKTTIKINIIYCTMVISDEKYSMNDGTALGLTTQSSTLQTGWAQKHMKNRWRSRFTAGWVSSVNTFWYQASVEKYCKLATKTVQIRNLLFDQPVPDFIGLFLD